MRVSYCYALREQNHLVYEANDAFLRRVPADVAPARWRNISRGFQMPAAETVALFEHLHARHDDKARVKIQLAPANLQWCSDKGLAMLADRAEKYDVPMHMHLVETPYQKEYARRRGGGTAVDYIERFGLLGSEADPRPRASGSRKAISTSSRRRAPASATIAAPISACAAACCRSTGWRRGASTPPSASTTSASTTIRTCCRRCAWCCAPIASPAWTIASRPWPRCSAWRRSGGARTTPYGTSIGMLEVGKAADMVLIDWKQISYPYLDERSAGARCGDPARQDVGCSRQ